MLELLGRRPMYGYELVQEIQAESGGVLAFGEGCIYPLLHKLEARGDLTSRRLQVGGRRRASCIASRRREQSVSAATENNGPMSWGQFTTSCKEASMSTSTHAPLKNIAAHLVRRGLPVDYASAPPPNSRTITAT